MSVFKSAFDSQNPAESPGCVSVQLSKKKKKKKRDLEVERERKRKPLTVRCLSARGRRLKASRWKVLGHDMDGAVLCCGFKPHVAKCTADSLQAQFGSLVLS